MLENLIVGPRNHDSEVGDLCSVARVITAGASCVSSLGSSGIRSPGFTIPAVAMPNAVRAASGDSTTQTEFRNVNFHLAPGVVREIRRLRGAVLSATPGQPVVFDDKRSVLIRIASAEVAPDDSGDESPHWDDGSASRVADGRSLAAGQSA